MVIYLLWSFTNRVFKDCTDLGGFVGSTVVQTSHTMVMIRPF